MIVVKAAGVYDADAEASYTEHLSVPDLSLGTYSIPAGAVDGQSPHTEDEVYAVVSGRGTFWTPTEAVAVGAGTVLFVPAGEEHRFVDVVEDLCVLVFFGPAEESRRPAVRWLTPPRRCWCASGRRCGRGWTRSDVERLPGRAVRARWPGGSVTWSRTSDSAS